MGPITPEDLRSNRFGLSLQESRVLALAMTGRIDKQIAAEMGISLGTVRVYWKRIRQKVGGTRSEVIAELARNALKLNFDVERDRGDKLAKDLEEVMLRERQLRVYESAFDQFSTALAILDGPAGRIVHANTNFAHLHGYAPGELDGMPSSDLMESGEAGRLERDARKIATATTAYDESSLRRRRDGKTFSANLKLTVTDEDIWLLAVTD